MDWINVGVSCSAAYNAGVILRDNSLVRFYRCELGPKYSTRVCLKAVPELFDWSG